MNQTPSAAPDPALRFAPEREDLRRVVEELKELGLAMTEEDFRATEAPASAEELAHQE